MSLPSQSPPLPWFASAFEGAWLEWERAECADVGIEVDALLRLAGVERGAVLDVPCGWGRTAIELARRGFVVTGVDLSARLLEEAARRATEAGVECTWVRADMREMAVGPSCFDLALDLYSSFGFFERAEEETAAWGRIVQALRPGAPLVVEGLTRDWLSRHFRPRTVMQRPGWEVENRQSFDQRTSRMRMEWTFRRRDGGDGAPALASADAIGLNTATAECHQVDVRIYTPGELCELLENAGATITRLCGDYEGRAYRFSSERLIVLAQRS